MFLRDDLRFSLRAIRRRPGLSALIVATGALGIGACIALFDLANLVAYMPIPGTDADRLVRVYNRHPQPFIGAYGYVPNADFDDYAREADSFEALLGIRGEPVVLRPSEESVAVSEGPVNADFVSGDFFQALGVEAEQGRLLEPDDDRPAAPIAAVLSHRFWIDRFAGDPEVVGQTVLLNDQGATIVGVVDPRFTGSMAADFNDMWVADGIGPRLLSTYDDFPNAPATDTLAVLRPGVSREQARSELQQIADRLDAERPRPQPREITVTRATYNHGLDVRNWQPILKMLGAAVVLLMILTCANIASLLFGRAIERSRDLAIRSALGSGRLRLLRQLFFEAVVLSFLAGGIGLLFALVARRVYGWWDLEDFAVAMQFDHRVLLPSLATCLVAALLFGLVPSWSASRVGLSKVARGEGGAVSRGALRLFQGLAAVQVTLATVLFVCMGLLVWNLIDLRNADLGFDDEGLVITSLYLGDLGYSRQAALEFMVELEEQAAALPGVVSTARSQLMPPVMLSVERTYRLPDEAEFERAARFNHVDDGFFATLGIPFVAGRPFDAREHAGPPTMIVNRRFVERTWPGLDPRDALDRIVVMQQRRPDDPPPEHRVVGVVETTRQHDLRAEGEPILYLPLDQRPHPAGTLVARVDGDHAPFARSILAMIRDKEPQAAMVRLRTSRQVRWEALVVTRLQSQSLALVAALGLLLSWIGVFGVLSMVVARRRREIGVRVALGADARRVRTWVLGRFGRIAASGLAIGLVLSIAATRLLRGWVEGLPATPLWLVPVVAVLLLLAVATATLVPVRRAARIDPVTELRGD